MVADQDKTNLPANTDSATRSATSILDAFTKGTALRVGLIYLCGFLALNSYLYKYGIVGLGIGNTNYVVTGSVFVLFLTIYALFGGRAIVLMKEWMSGHIKMIVEAGGPSSDPRSAFAHSFIELTFFTCLSAAFFTSIAIDVFESFWFYAVLGVGFLIIYPLDVSDYDRKHPYAFLHIDGAIKLLAIVSFFIFPPAEKRIHVFLTFMGFSTYINIVLDTFERYRINTDRIMFTIVYSVIFFLGSAITFGAFFYRDVSRKIGGGKPIEMEMGIEPTSLTAAFFKVVVASTVFIMPPSGIPFRLALG